MINPAELRIGNWVVNPGATSGPEYGRLTQIYMEGFTVDYHYPGGWYEPILLTPELLEKCGFEKKKNHIYKIEVFHGDLVIGKLPEDKEYRLTEIQFNDAREWLQAATLMPVKYLHQLQNLYFALTGKELTYTP